MSKTLEELYEELKAEGDDFETFFGGVSTQESGGNPKARNKRTGAAGRWQIMPKNIGPWSQEVLGRSVSEQEFMGSPDIQEQISRAKLRQYYDRARELGVDPRQGAALAWYTGEDALRSRKDYERSMRIPSPAKGEPSASKYVSEVVQKSGPGRAMTLEELYAEMGGGSAPTPPQAPIPTPAPVEEAPARSPQQAPPIPGRAGTDQFGLPTWGFTKSEPLVSGVIEPMPTSPGLTAASVAPTAPERVVGSPRKRKSRGGAPGAGNRPLPPEVLTHPAVQGLPEGEKAALAEAWPTLDEAQRAAVLGDAPALYQGEGQAGFTEEQATPEELAQLQQESPASATRADTAQPATNPAIPERFIAKDGKDPKGLKVTGLGLSAANADGRRRAVITRTDLPGAQEDVYRALGFKNAEEAGRFEAATGIDLSLRSKSGGPMTQEELDASGYNEEGQRYAPVAPGVAEAARAWLNNEYNPTRVEGRKRAEVDIQRRAMVTDRQNEIDRLRRLGRHGEAARLERELASIKEGLDVQVKQDRVKQYLRTPNGPADLAWAEHVEKMRAQGKLPGDRKAWQTQWEDQYTQPGALELLMSSQRYDQTLLYQGLRHLVGDEEAKQATIALSGAREGGAEIELPMDTPATPGVGAMATRALSKPVRGFVNSFGGSMQRSDPQAREGFYEGSESDIAMREQVVGLGDTAQKVATLGFEPEITGEFAGFEAKARAATGLMRLGAAALRARRGLYAYAQQGGRLGDALRAPGQAPTALGRGIEATLQGAAATRAGRVPGLAVQGALTFGGGAALDPQQDTAASAAEGAVQFAANALFDRSGLSLAAKYGISGRGAQALSVAEDAIRGAFGFAVPNAAMNALRGRDQATGHDLLLGALLGARGSLEGSAQKRASGAPVAYVRQGGRVAAFHADGRITESNAIPEAYRGQVVDLDMRSPSEPEAVRLFDRMTGTGPAARRARVQLAGELADPVGPGLFADEGGPSAAASRAADVAWRETEDPRGLAEEYGERAFQFEQHAVEAARKGDNTTAEEAMRWAARFNSEQSRLLTFAESPENRLREAMSDVEGLTIAQRDFARTEIEARGDLIAAETMATAAKKEWLDEYQNNAAGKPLSDPNRIRELRERYEQAQQVLVDAQGRLEAAAIAHAEVRQGRQAAAEDLRAVQAEVAQAAEARAQERVAKDEEKAAAEQQQAEEAAKAEEQQVQTREELETTIAEAQDELEVKGRVPNKVIARAKQLAKRLGLGEQELVELGLPKERVRATTGEGAEGEAGARGASPEAGGEGAQADQAGADAKAEGAGAEPEGAPGARPGAGEADRARAVGAGAGRPVASGEPAAVRTRAPADARGAAEDVSEGAKPARGVFNELRANATDKGLTPEAADAVVALAREEEGASIRPDLSEPTEGFMVSLPGHEESWPVEELTGAKVADYAKRKADLLADPKNHLGLWEDKGRFYLDISENVGDQATAERLGRDRFQYGVFDVKGKTTVDTSEKRKLLDEVIAAQRASNAKYTEEEARDVVDGVFFNFYHNAGKRLGISAADAYKRVQGSAAVVTGVAPEPNRAQRKRARTAQKKAIERGAPVATTEANDPPTPGQMRLFQFQPGQGPGLVLKQDGPTGREQGVPASRKIAEAYASQYAEKLGLRPPRWGENHQLDQTVASRIADYYDAQEHRPNDKRVSDSYKALVRETTDQFKFLQKSGVKIVAWDGEGEAYPEGSGQMIEDVRKNNRLLFLKTDPKDLAADHPLAKTTRITVPTSGGGTHTMLANDLFRAVHDFMAHSTDGFQFGARGEFNATLKHAELYSEAARGAMVNETLGQNSWVNFGRHIRRPDGTVPVKGDADFVPPQDRPFAPQKAGLVPEALWPEQLRPALATTPVRQLPVRTPEDRTFARDEGRRRAAERGAQHGADPVLSKWGTSSLPLLSRPLDNPATGKGSYTTNWDIAQGFDSYVAARGGQLAPDSDPEARYQRGLRSVLDELGYQIDQPGGGGDWYRSAIGRTVNVMATVPGFERLSTDPEHARLFKTLLAPTSPQADPRDNLEKAALIYEGWIASGMTEFPARRPNGKEWGYASIAASLPRIQRLINDKGLKGANDWLETAHDSAEILREYKENLSWSERNDIKEVGGPIYGWLIFGPKAGRFAANIHSVSDEVTVDVWASRSWNRWMGTLDAWDTQSEKEMRDRDAKGEEAWGIEGQDWRWHPSRPGVRQRRGVQGIPRDGAERALIIRTFTDAATSINESLAKKGLPANVKPADVQALLWFYEQNLWRLHGSEAASWGFDQAALDFARTRGADVAPELSKDIPPVVGFAEGGAASRRTGGGTRLNVAEREAGAGLDEQVLRQEGDVPVDPQTRTPNFKRYFADSKVTNPDGTPRVVYHGTVADFVVPRTLPENELGFHVGTAEQATERGTMVGNYDRLRHDWKLGDPGTNLKPLYAAIKNPLRMPDVGTFNFNYVSQALIDQGTLTRDEVKAMEKAYHESADAPVRRSREAILREALEAKGYDGVVYANQGETVTHPTKLRMDAAQRALEQAQRDGWDEEGIASHRELYEKRKAEWKAAVREGGGVDDSFIAFSPQQLKSAIGNSGAFDPQQRSILKQEGERLPDVTTASGAKLSLYHLSKVPGLTELDPAKLGEGVPAAETRRGVPELKRTFYYVEGTKPEPMVSRMAPHRYVVDPVEEAGVYDIGTDPEGFIQRAKDANRGAFDSETMLKMLKDAGYAGYRNTRYEGMENVVALFGARSARQVEQVFAQPIRTARSRVTKGQTVLTDGKRLMSVFENGDVSTLVHEFAHGTRTLLSGDDHTTATDFVVNGTGLELHEDGAWREEHEEYYARSFERYLRDGAVPHESVRPVFERLKGYLANIYTDIQGSDIDEFENKGQRFKVKLTPEIKAMWDRLLMPPEVGDEGPIDSGDAGPGVDEAGAVPPDASGGGGTVRGVAGAPPERAVTEPGQVQRDVAGGVGAGVPTGTPASRPASRVAAANPNVHDRATGRRARFIPETVLRPEAETVEASDYVNLGRLNLPPEEIVAGERLTQNWVAEQRALNGGKDPKDVKGFAAIESASDAMRKELKKEFGDDWEQHFRKPADGATLTDVEHHVLRSRYVELTAGVARAREELQQAQARIQGNERARWSDRLTVDEMRELRELIEDAEAEATDLEWRARRVFDVLYPARKAAGRNLAYMRMQAGRDFDPEVWTARARREAERRGVDVDSDEWYTTEQKITNLAAGGRAAQQKVDSINAEIDRAIRALNEDGEAPLFQEGRRPQTLRQESDFFGGAVSSSGLEMTEADFAPQQPKAPPKERVATMRQRFGTTQNPHQGSFIDHDGEMIAGFKDVGVVFHESVLKAAGLRESPESFMKDTGVIRMRVQGKQANFELHASPTREQVDAMVVMGIGKRVAVDLYPRDGKPHYLDLGNANEKELDRAFDEARDILSGRRTLKQTAPMPLANPKAAPVPPGTDPMVAFGASVLARRGITGEQFVDAMATKYGQKFETRRDEVFLESYRTRAWQRQQLTPRQGAALANRTVAAGGNPFDPTHLKAQLDAQAQARKDAAKARADLARAFNALQASTTWEIVTALRKAGLLSGPRTHFRNVLSNTVYQAMEELALAPATVIDSLVALKTGQRTVVFDPLGAAKGVGQALSARKGTSAATQGGLSKAIDIMRNGTPDWTADRLQTGRELRINSDSIGARALEGYTKVVFRALGASDAIFNTYATRRALENIAKAQAINEADAGTVSDWRQRAEELVNNPPKEMADTAMAEGLLATFNNSNILSDKIAEMKRSLDRAGNLGSAGRFVFDTLVPFDRTPTNILNRLFEYGPGGLAKGIAKGAQLARGKKTGGLGSALFEEAFTPEERRALQRQMSRQTGRGLVGTTILMGVALWFRGYFREDSELVNLGDPNERLSGYAPEDKGEAATNRATGKVPMSVKVGGRWYQVAGLAPAGSLLTIGATLGREWERNRTEKKKDDVGSLVAAGGLATVKNVLELPMLQGARMLVDSLNKPERFAEGLTGNLLGSFVPTAIADTASALDGKERKPESIGDRIAQRVPGLRSGVPEATDPLNRPSSKRSVLDPFASVPDRAQIDPLDAELRRVAPKLNYADKSVPRFKGETEEQYRDRQARTGDAKREALEKLFASRRYLNAKPNRQQTVVEVQREMIEEAMRGATTKVNNSVAKERRVKGVEKE
jgi:hypothetical protein